MPKITEETVSQHRAVQHRAVLEAAERLIVEGHGKMPSLGDVAAEVDLARSSIYRYVSSQHDLLVQLLLQATERWNQQLRNLLDEVPPEPEHRICAYVDVTLDLFVHGSHGPVMVAVQNFPAAFADEKVQASHDGFKLVMKELCPGISYLEISLLNAAILGAAEKASDPVVLEQATDILYAMAKALVR